MILAKPPLVGGLVAMTLAFSQKYWVSVIIPIDELHHFSEGWPRPTNQLQMFFDVFFVFRLTAPGPFLAPRGAAGPVPTARGAAGGHSKDASLGG